MLAGAETASSPRATRRSRRSTSRPNWARATSTRRRARSTARSTSSSGSKRAAARAARSEGRKRGRRRARRASAEAQGARSRTSTKPKPPGGDGLVPARRSRRSSRRRRSPARSARGFPVFYPTRLPSGAYYVESNTYEHVAGPARLPPQGHRGQVATAPTGWSASSGARRRNPLLRHPGDPGLVGPADPRQPEPDQDDPRPRIRDLRRRRARQDGRLAPRRQHLLGRRTTCSTRLTNEQMMGMARSANVIIPNEEAESRGGRSG